MIHLGDITKLDGSRIPPVDIITGGSPCQDLSVAGKREGLAGERSGLFMEQVRIVKEMREATNGEYPKQMLWENVCGAFSSNGGEDFRAVIEEIARIADKDAVIPGPPKGKWTHAGYVMGDGWSIAWRVHDAQFWGVPQRRKRIALVADFRDGGGTAEILFEHKGLSGNTEESEEAREEAAGDFGESTQVASGFTNRGFESGDLTETLRSNPHGAYPMVVYGISAYESNAMKSKNPNSGIYEAETVRTLDLNGGSPACNQGGMVVLEGNGNRPSHQGDGYAERNTMYTLNATEHHAVCYPINTMVGTRTTDENRTTMGIGDEGDPQFTLSAAHSHAVCYPKEPAMIEMTSTKNTVVEDGISPTLTARMGTGGNQVNAICISNGQANQSIGNVVNTLTNSDYKGGQCVMTYQDIAGTLSPGQHAGSYNGQDASNDMFVSNGYIVRRLTPLECERLQGFPDGWTDIGDWMDFKGKKHKASDSPRYKALGNSIALPFWEWLAGRMVKSLGVENPTMGSLFDGISGFPLVFAMAGCKPVWTSEIEEFAIAVCKKHFGDENKGGGFVEIFIPVAVPGFEELYSVSNMGRVRSEKSKKNPKTRNRPIWLQILHFLS